MGKPSFIRIYCVGSANCILINYDDGRSLLFDCGIDVNEIYQRKYARSKEEIISKLSPTAVVISHEHRDHYNLFCDINSIMSSLELLVRKADNDSSIYDNIRNSLLSARGSYKEKVVFDSIDKDYLINKGYEETYIYMGTGAVPPPDRDLGIMSYDNSINDSGLILVVKHGKHTVILPADVSYYSWPDEAKSEIDNATEIVLPHHGGAVYIDDCGNIKSNASLYMSSRRLGNEITDLNGTGSKNGKGYVIMHKTFIDNRFNDTTVTSTRSVPDCDPDLGIKTDPYIEITL